MSKHDGTLTRRWKVSVPNRNVSSKVSKVSSICGYLLAFCCFSIWISSPFVTADKHTYGSINETNGLCVCVVLIYPLRSTEIFHQSLIQSKYTFSQSTAAEVILNRRIFERTTPVPTNYTIIYKYVRNRLGGQISYIEFDVANCVSWAEYLEIYWEFEIRC